MGSVLLSGILSLSIALLFTHVNAAEKSLMPNAGQTLDALITRTLERGRKKELGPFASEMLGLAAETPFVSATVPAKAAADGLDHDFRIMIDASSDTLKPLFLLLSTREKRITDRKAEVTYYRMSLAGASEKITRITGGIDDKGKSVKGSAVTEAVDHKSPAAQKLARAELDFWVKGVGRKPEPVAKEAESGPSPSPGLDKHH